MPDNEQLTIPFDTPTQPESYTVTIAAGPVHEEAVLRSHIATSVTDALSFVDALRDTYAGRESVQWNGEDVNAEGKLYGLGPKGLVYVIAVTPPINLSWSE